MNSKELICCANEAEKLRLALHRKNKMAHCDCKEYRQGVLTVLSTLGFLTYDDESIDITNIAGACDKELRGEVKCDYWTEHHINKRGYGAIEYLHKDCTGCGIELFKSPYEYCPNCGMKMLRKERANDEES